MDQRADEAALLEAFAAGDRAAGERLVEVSYRTIWGALCKLTGGDVELAADLTQETYRKAWQALPGFRGRSRFSTWLYRIAYTTFLNHVRRPRPLSPLDEEQAEAVVEERPGPESVLATSLESERLRRAVLALPDDLRFTVTARFWSELSVREIAELEEITTVAIRKRLKKAYGALRLALEEEVA